MKLSILMPVYNEEAYIEEAIDSVLAQRVDFEYEMIIVNDGSTDRTAEIIKDYQQRYSQIRQIGFPQNRGAAVAVCTALEAARGEYFLVLDGDDYLLHPRKLQRQVDFLDHHPDHVAVAHNYLLQEGELFRLGVPLVDEQKSYCGEDGYQGLGYFHTATYMFRNIFQGNPPSLWKEGGIGWCDNIRLMTCLAKTEKKVKALNFVGSVYRYNGEGIWSSLSQEKQLKGRIERHRLLLHSGLLKNSVFARRVAEKISEMEARLKKTACPGIGSRLNGSLEGFRLTTVLMLSYIPLLSKFIGSKRRERYMQKLIVLQESRPS